jgi:hypothetical protein
MPFAITPPLREVDPREHVDRLLVGAADRDPTLALYFVNGEWSDGLKSIALGNLTTPEGEAVAPDDAAEQLVALLRSARRTGTQDGGGELPGGEPLGVVVTADIELIGLRHRPVMLTWQMWQLGGQVRLYDEWLNKNLAYVLEATTDHQTRAVDLWVPLPKEPGPYFIRLLLTAEQSPLASEDSEAFP